MTPQPPRCSITGRLIKRAQVQGAQQVDAETYKLYVAGRHVKGNAADGPFSAAVTVDGFEGEAGRVEHLGGILA